MNVLDEKIVSELKGLLGDDYITVFEAFVRSADQAVHELNLAVKVDDINKVETIIHTLKGSSANIGAKNLSKICADMHDDIRNSITDKFKNYLDMIDNEYGKVKESIKYLMK